MREVIFLLLGISVPLCSAYLSIQPLNRAPPTSSLTSRRVFFNDFEDLEGFDDADDDVVQEGDDDLDLFASLRKRQAALRDIKTQSVWRTSPSSIDALPLANDWVRRVAMDEDDPDCSHVAVGGASGSIYLVDLKTGETKGNLAAYHPQGIEDFTEGAAAEILPELYGDFDGGGILALAKKGSLIASAGRNGGVGLSRVVGDDNNPDNALETIGRIAQLDQQFVTSLAFDENGMLWIGSSKRRRATIQGVDCSALLEDIDSTDTADTTELVVKSESRSSSTATSVLSISLSNDIGCGVATLGTGGVALFSLETGKFLDAWKVAFKSDSELARSAVFVQNDEALIAAPTKVSDPKDPTKEALMVATPTWSVVVGGSEGSLHQRRIAVGSRGRVSDKTPWDDMTPPQVIADQFKHSGSIVCLASPGPKTFLSAAQDGTIRVWDCSYLRPKDEVDEEEAKDDDFLLQVGTRPRPQFAMQGYKVWLGSMVLWKKSILVTDGADNCVIGHYFTGKKEGEGEE